MSLCCLFLSCVLPALSPVFSQVTAPVALQGEGPRDPAAEHGVPALFSWADLDGDGRLDLAAVTAGELQVLTSTADGRFEDVTGEVGLAAVDQAALALWADYDGDSRLDLFVGSRSGASRLFHNEGGLFVDVSAGSGLVSEGAVQSAQWLDHDGDGRLDLFLVTAEEGELCTRLFRGLEGGFFEVAELGSFPGTSTGPAQGGATLGDGALSDPVSSGPRGVGPVDSDTERGAGSVHPWVTPDGVSPKPGGIAAPPSSTGMITIAPYPLGCASSVKDQANPSTCLEASTTPTLGSLYPISANLFVAVGGNVGVGTTSPTARLHVAGTARVTDTLTLAPSGDQALDVSTGSIYKGGALFIHTKGFIGNTAIGYGALQATSGGLNTAVGNGALNYTTTGSGNSAVGGLALSYNTTGSSNTAVGSLALFYNTTGDSNTASGRNALYKNTAGNGNTSVGSHALFENTTGSNNTATGLGALQKNTTGGFNAAHGVQALVSNTTGYTNTAIGGRALFSNTTGNGNTAGGSLALFANTTGNRNVADGEGALVTNTTGSDNTACGRRALLSNTSGSRNIAIGNYAGASLTTGNDNINIGDSGPAAESATIRLGDTGTHVRAFIAGIRGVTTDIANAIPVLVDSAGQLGTVSSSRRFKTDIRDMGDATERLLELRPVLFRYKQEQTLPGGQEVPPEYGLIAEEVAEVFPDLVVYDEEGQPFTVKYHLLSSMLLNELKKLKEAHGRQLEELRSEVTRLRGLEARLATLESRASPIQQTAVPFAGGR